MKKAVLTADRLRFKINYDEPKFLVNYLFNCNSKIFCKKVNSKKDSKFLYNYFLNYKNVFVGLLEVSRMNNKNFSQLKIENHLLYTHQNLLKDLFSVFKKIDLDIDVASLEIAIDYQQKSFRNKVERLIRKSKLKLTNKYKFHYCGDDNDGNNYIKNHAVSRYIESNKRQSKAYLRLEDKTIEIQKSKKSYITNYHELNGLDITKKVYRFELVIPTSQNFISSNNIEYVSNKNDSKTISKSTLQRYIKQKNQLENELKTNELLFDNGYNRLNDLINEFTIKRNVKYRYDIDIARLFEKEYLLTIFNVYSSKIIKNRKELFSKIIYRISSLLSKKIIIKRKDKIMSDEDKTKFDFIVVLTKILDKSFEDISENYPFYENLLKNINIKEYNKNDLYDVVNF
ncbi:hypothetical protein [Psychroflexus halocasei]|uniref:Uncharacterized protein n=1 Tax=Psychroflexus halocasei TaxID=908615 RepID=A0A1H4DXL3_9FLAO|nr:hypothetical protein [Psychroflexus halocasei]SEA77545.1 hypothetical protein SAMN05421540_1184 [Psychroflexus halocasei]